jgi:hypothetical protein
MRRADVVVLHAYGPRVAVLDGNERAALLNRVREFFDGSAPMFTVCSTLANSGMISDGSCWLYRRAADCSGRARRHDR